MPRDYRIEGDAIIDRWYGGNSQPRNPRPNRSWAKAPIFPGDCLGIPMQVNSPYMPLGHCMVSRYALNSEGYGILTVDRKRELAHRVVYRQTRGRLPEGRQLNHLCDRPYCVQPSHLYAGTIQDNKDDSRIFRKEEFANAPAVLLWRDWGDKDDPFLNRLVESDRYDGAEPWEPVEHPAQRPFEEFTCPRHDFAIPMFGGISKICRICEISDLDESTLGEPRTLLLIAELCPISQTVLPILDKIAASEFVGDSNRGMRQRADRRRTQGSHYLRNCRCEYCIRDRKAFRCVIWPVLTCEESDLLDICDRLESQIIVALGQASEDIMDGYAKLKGLNHEQGQALREHHGACLNTRSELSSTSRTIEGELGYLLHAILNFRTGDEMLEDQSFQLIMSRWNLIRLNEEDEEPILNVIKPVAETTAIRLAEAWEREADDLTRPYFEIKPELYEDIRRLAKVLTVKQVLEHLRYELLGRNSYSEQEPRPHADCAASISATGRVQSVPLEFREGLGYMTEGTAK